MAVILPTLGGNAIRLKIVTKTYKKRHFLVSFNGNFLVVMSDIRIPMLAFLTLIYSLNEMPSANAKE